MIDDIKDLQKLLLTANKFYVDARNKVLVISGKAKTNIYETSELCDIGFLCREVISQCEEIRKDIGAVKTLIDKVVCIKIMNESLQNPRSVTDTVQGELSSGMLHFKKTALIPAKDTEQYKQMMKFFGVSEEGIKIGIAKIGWQEISKYVTELTEQGKPIPDFVPKVYDEYTITYRRKS